MITLEIHPEIHVEEQFQRPAYSTCRECRHTFHAKSEDQLSLELCDRCFHTSQYPEDPVPTAHVKVLPRQAIVR